VKEKFSKLADAENPALHLRSVRLNFLQNHLSQIEIGEKGRVDLTLPFRNETNILFVIAETFSLSLSAPSGQLRVETGCRVQERDG